MRLADRGARIPEAEVRGADEIWVTSSTKEVLAVTTLDGKPVGGGKPGAVFRMMHQLYPGIQAHGDAPSGMSRSRDRAA